MIRPLLEALFATTALYVCYGLIFMALERLRPARRRQARWREGFGVDVAYVYTFAVIAFALEHAGVASLAGPSRFPALAHVLVPFATWLRTLPVAVEVLVAVVIADFFGYWKHRLLHTRWLWPIHAIHHGSREVDWLSSERAHPIEGLLTTSFQLFPLLLLGFSPIAIGVASAIRRTHSLYEHGNLGITYGRVERIVVSPRLHRSHHAADPEGRDTNFANIFSLFDTVFGTFRAPREQEPAVLGLGETPRGFWGQLVAPFGGG